MMIHELTKETGGHKRSQRKGRGESSGRGKTCGRGNKGSGARGGGPHWVPGHEGGQTKSFRRYPKRGFSNDNFERRFHIVNLGDLEQFPDGTTVDAAALIEAGLVPDDSQPVKILSEGSFTKKLTIVAGWFSRSAREKITKAGGVAQNMKGEAFEFPKPKAIFVPREEVKKSKKKGEDPAGDAKAEGTPGGAKGAEPKAEKSAEAKPEEPSAAPQA